MSTSITSNITPYLWLPDRLREAVEFYVALFPNSEVKAMNEVAPGVATAEFVLDGQPFLAMSSDRSAPLTPGVSFHVSCQTQDEVDRYWDALTSGGGEEQPCGWLVDRFGVSWQIIPRALSECLGNPDPERAQRAMNAMLGMKKLDISALSAAVA
ncbi:MAG TPA: VOC family protein [Tepidiformaceae bacterium]|nr:VOC family protein [Tepidiformaceae bacterium]